MAVKRSKIQFKRGPKAMLPLLREGEPGFTLDTGELFIGDGTQNRQIGGGGASEEVIEQIQTDVSGLKTDVLSIKTDVQTLNTNIQVVKEDLEDVKQFEGYLVPQGGIIMWSGAIVNIPAGWALCDGTQNTPNLRDRFIVGAGSTYAVDATGGSNTVALTTANLASHGHTFSSGAAASNGSHLHSLSGLYTNSSGNHNHGVNTFYNHGGSSGPTFARIDGYQTASYLYVDSNGDHTHTVSGTMANGGDHTHTVTGTVGNSGSGTAHENRPPYYALAFIMKL